MKPQGYIPPSASPSAHEGADLNVPLVVRIVVILAATLVVLVLLVVFLFHYFNHEYPARTSEAAPVITAADLPPQPRLQVDPKRELEEVRANEDKHLDHYAWVDQQKGFAQIPIDRAMALWVKNYSPSAPVTNAAVAPTELQMRQQKAKGDGNAP
jgi:cell division protein FtsN